MKNLFKRTLGILMLITISIVIAQINLESGVALAMALPIGFSPLKWAAGTENMGGYKNRLLFIPAGSVSAVPELPDVIAASLDLVTAAGAFTFTDPLDKPIFIYATDKTVQYDAENQGEADGQSFRQFGQFIHPGAKAEVSAFARKVNNTPGYIILEDPAGVQYMVGSKGMPCTLKPSFAGGAARTDKKGSTFTFEADSFAPFVILGTPIDIDALENAVVAP